MPGYKKGKHRVTGAMVTAMFALTSFQGAAAQTIDYGTLETLFDEPVTTSATGNPQRISEVPVALEIITSNQIRRMGVTSLPEILNRMPGLTSWQATRHSADVGIRGQNTAYNQTLLVLVNGRQVYIDVNGYTDWSLIPVQLEEIWQIEVVKGPATALYGFNAVSGVVNIVTYNPLYYDRDEVGVAAGTNAYGRAYGVNTAQLSDRVSIRLSGSVEGSDEFDLRSKTGYTQISNFRDEARNRKLMADGLIQLNDTTQLRLQASHADSKKTDAFITLYGLPSDKAFHSGNATLISDTSLGQVQANLYTNISHEKLSGRINTNVDSRVIVAQLSDLFKIGVNHSFRLQTEVRHNSMESRELIGPAGSEVSSELAAAGGMWNWSINPTLEWTNAVRIDHLMLDRSGALNAVVPFAGNEDFDQNITDYSLNSGMVWKITERDSMRASYGRGIGAPSMVELGLQFPLPNTVPPTIVTGNPTLEPTVVHHYEVGYDRLLEAINGKFRSSFFLSKTEDISTIGSSTNFSNGLLILGTSRIGNSKTAGMELGLQGTIGQKWNWDASYMYQNSVDSFSGVTATTTPYTTRYENTIPHHTLKGHIGYTTGQWEMDMYGEVASEFDAIVDLGGAAYSIVPLDSYFTVGGRIGYTFSNDMTLALMGSELAHSRVTNNYGLENERRIFVQLSKQF